MENLDLSLFDIFGFIIPGSVILISIILIFNFKRINEIPYFLNSISSTQLLFYVILAYIIGFIADNISYWLYSFLGPYLRWRSNYTFEQFSLESRAKIHFESPENFSIIERWNALKTFSYNLSFSILILSIYFFKAGLKRNKQLILFLLCLLVSGLLLNKAHMYGEYYEREVKKTIQLINKKKAAISSYQPYSVVLRVYNILSAFTEKPIF